MDSEAVSDGLERHIRNFFADREVVDRSSWIEPHVRERLPRLRLLEVVPTEDDGAWVYGTIGAWEVTKAERHGLELVYVAPSAGPGPARLAVMAAYYHANPGDESYRLWEGHTVPIGRPLAPGSTLDHLLVSKPYPFGPDLEVAELDDAHVHFFWLLPITSAEAAYRHEHDLEALERLFDEVGIEFWRTDRESVVG